MVGKRGCARRLTRPALAAQVASTLISSTSVARMRQNLDAVGATLSADEEAALQKLVEDFFGPAGQQSWEGVELAAYWQGVGKTLMIEKRYASPAEHPPKKARL